MMESTTGHNDGSERAKDQANKRADEAKDWARSAFDDRKHAAADEVDGLVRAAHQTADQLRQQNQGSTAGYVNTAADTLQRFSGTLRDGDVNSLMRQSQDFARRRPLLFLGGAVAIGVALGRFFNSSATRSGTDYHGESHSGGIDESDHRYAGQRSGSASAPRTPPVLGDNPTSGGINDGR